MPLIESPRHTAADLELWRSLEVADRLHARFITRKVDQSLDAIREFVSAGECYCGVSWGKDSVVVGHLARIVDRSIPLVHLRPTNHNPDCDFVRDDYFKRFPGQRYSEVAVDYSHITSNCPDSDRDELTDKKWYAAIDECDQRFGSRHVLGIRKDESGGRAIRMMTHGLNSKNGSAPIGWWTTQDVFAYLAVIDLPVHPAYACLGGGRWARDQLRVAEIGDTHGKQYGRGIWEKEYYGET